MSDIVTTGLFMLAGTAMGGIISYRTALIGFKKERARKKILDLCDQVSAFYQLEMLYKEELSGLDPNARSAKTIMEEMRSKVEEGDFVRPDMTSRAASKIRREWS